MLKLLGGLSMSTEEVKKNIKNSNSWIRLLFIIIFLVFYGIGETVFWFSVLVQVIFTLFTGKVNANLKEFTGKLVVYLYSVLKYVSFQTEEKPFPFAAWPKSPEQIETAANESDQSE
jgi:hypothetical protein